MGIFNTAVNFVLGVVVTVLSTVGIQTPLTPPTLTVTASPAIIEEGESTVLEWASKGADKCVSVQLDTGNNVSGSQTVSPGKTTTYSVTCSKTQTNKVASGTWVSVGSDVTDLWCTNNQPTFKNFYTENECPSDFTEGGACTAVNETCAVNHWQTKGGTVGDLGSKQYCNLITDLYRCTSGTGNTSTAGAGSATKTVYSGDFGNLVAPHLQYRGALQKDVDANGGPFVMDGFYDDKATADRICAVLFQGSSNGTYQSDKYKSPKNNTVLRWDGSRWTQQNAKNHPRHLRYSFTCVAPSSVAAPAPTSQTKSVTKSVTVTVVPKDITEPEDDDTDPNLPGGGGGGGGNCSDGVDNDNDGRIDSADYACAGGSANESPNPQCSDGIDNNGDGLVDYPDDSRCSSYTDTYEDQIPAALLSLTSEDKLVRKFSTATLTWETQNITAGSCSLRGSNGDLASVTVPIATYETPPMVAETIYTLSCVDLRGESVSTEITIKIAPSFNEE